MAQSEFIAVCYLLCQIAVTATTESTSSPKPTSTTPPIWPLPTTPSLGVPTHSDLPSITVTEKRQIAGKSTRGSRGRGLSTWVKCLTEGTKNISASDMSVAGVFRTWCRSYKHVIPCLEAGIPAHAETNALDFFISLTFDPTILRRKSTELCEKINVLSDRLRCVSNTSAEAASFCTDRFGEAIRHIFLGFKAGVKRPALVTMICELTRTTTGCLSKTLDPCDLEVRQFLLSYYALFTGENCIAKPGEIFDTSPVEEFITDETVPVKCGRIIQDSSNVTGELPASVRDGVVKGLRIDCRTYEQRFLCYEENLKRAKNFWDLWLNETFDRQNAVDGHKKICSDIEGIISELTEDCFNLSQTIVLRCETFFATRAGEIRMKWLQKSIDSKQLREEACNASIERGMCYRIAFNNCNPRVGESISLTQLGPLPDVCQAKVPSRRRQGVDNSNNAVGQSTTTAGPKDAGSVNKVSNILCLFSVLTAFLRLSSLSVNTG